MSVDLINSENMLKLLKIQMNKEMAEAAEPVIRKAVEEAEKEIRKRLGAMFVAMIDKDINIERYGTDLRILVRHDKT